MPGICSRHGRFSSRFGGLRICCFADEGESPQGSGPPSIWDERMDSGIVNAGRREQKETALQALPRITREKKHLPGENPVARLRTLWAPFAADCSFLLQVKAGLPDDGKSRFLTLSLQLNDVDRLAFEKGIQVVRQSGPAAPWILPRRKPHAGSPACWAYEAADDPAAAGVPSQKRQCPRLQLAAVQSVRQGLRINHRATGQVKQQRAILHLRKGLGANQAAGRVVKRAVKRYDIRIGQQPGSGHALDSVQLPALMRRAGT